MGRIAAIVVGAFGAGCAGAAPPEVPDPIRSEACLVRPTASAPGADTVAMVLTDRLASADWSAPTSLVAERTLAGLLYRGLVRIDCQGRRSPDLALSWKSLQGGLVWEFALPAGQRLADGNPLDAAAVQASFERRPLPWIRAVEARADLTVRFRLASPADTIPMAFGTTAAAVVGVSRAAGLPPVESGDYRWGGQVEIGRGGRTVTLARWRSPSSASATDGGFAGPSVLRIGLDRQADPRDRLDVSGAAPVLMITSDPATIEYARARTDLRVESLGWDRLYGLAFGPGLAVGAPTDSERLALARDAVRADLRPAADSLCPPLASRPRESSRRLVAFEEIDPIGRRLAERVVALLGTSAPPAWLAFGSDGGTFRAAGFRGAALDSSVAMGAVDLAVVSRPISAVRGQCEPGTTGWVGLVESRPYLILGPGAPVFERGADGALRLVGSGRP